MFTRLFEDYILKKAKESKNGEPKDIADVEIKVEVTDEIQKVAENIEAISFESRVLLSETKKVLETAEQLASRI